MKRLRIQHHTQYTFSSPVYPGSHRLFLRPREGHDLRIASSSLTISSEPAVTWSRDYYDNVLALVTFDNQVLDAISIASDVEVELYDERPLNFIVEERAVRFPLSYSAEELQALGPYLQPVYPDDRQLRNWLEPYRCLPLDTETFAVLDGINKRIHGELRYQVRAEEGVRPPGVTLRLGEGACRDFAALLMEACRRLGIAARFVSGYVHGSAAEAGGAATHAWTEVYLPGAGWKGFDPTEAAVVGPDHIPVAVHNHPQAIPPVSGSFTGHADVVSTLAVDVRINRLPPLAES
jgi:transglutaminase-like putative cysteine protease